MKLTIITKPLCPYCGLLAEYLARYQAKEGTELSLLEDGQPDAQAYDYYYLPAVFLDGRRVIHGKTDKKELIALLEQAMQKKQE